VAVVTASTVVMVVVVKVGEVVEMRRLLLLFNLRKMLGRLSCRNVGITLALVGTIVGQIVSSRRRRKLAASS
jgi:hypothetical protein